MKPQLNRARWNAEMGHVALTVGRFYIGLARDAHSWSLMVELDHAGVSR